jgi:histidinol dehydrogenase
VLDYTTRFDGVMLLPRTLRFSAAEIEAAADRVGAEVMAALRTAHDRIRAHHETQRPADHIYRDALGVTLGTRWTPVESVGIYVPGGLASYPSSVLMNAVPAAVAGVPRIAMAVPTPHGEVNDAVLAAARLAGVTEIYRVGGAQAIAALAYGTPTIAAVDKICGPGNAYVAAAKRRVFGAVGIDMVAGASEVLVIADGTANPDWVALDLFAQAEHDEMAQAILLSPDAAIIAGVAESARRLLATMPRAPIIAAALARRGALILTRDLDEACAIANRIAPEHLELAVADPEPLLAQLRHAGALFVGHYSSEALGDYCAGPNHVLPTGRTARFSSPLGVYDFQKRTSVLRIAPATARALAPIAATLAAGEGLAAHARSALARLDGE